MFQKRFSETISAGFSFMKLRLLRRHENMALSAVYRLCEVFSNKFYNPNLVNVRNIKRCQTATLIALRERNKKYREKIDPKKLLELERRSNFAEWNRNAEVYAFGKRLQEDFRPDLLDLAFTHRSYNTLQKQKLSEFQVAGDADMKDNQELAEIGGKIISNHVWNYFSHFYPRFPLEGIEKVHEHFTSDQLLAHISENLGTTHIILSADYPIEKETYSVTLKAIVGALMESQGIDKANIFVRDFIVTQFTGNDINDFLPIQDYFLIVKEIMERDKLKEPEPRIICQSGTKTILANYHIGIYSDKKLYGHGSGEAVDIAIQMAALDVLKRFFHTTDSSKPLRYDAELNYEGKIRNNLPLSEWCTSRFADKRS